MGDKPTTSEITTEKTILVVDDNPTNLGVVADYLEGHGFVVLVASNGQSGLEKAQYIHPDIILLDVMMPGIDGFETCRQLKANESTRNIPVIFMTALTETTHKVEAFTAGAVDYVTKPIQQEEVLARVRTHLRLRELTETLEQKVAERTAQLEERTFELEQAYNKLAELDRAKADFIFVVSHELRTPLAVISGYSQLLKSSPLIVENEELNGLLTQLLRGNQRMLDVVNETLEATKIDQGSLQLYPEEVLLGAVIQEVGQQFATALQERRLTLRLLDIFSWPPVHGDYELLSRLFYHVLVNAIKYTPNGGWIEVQGRTVSLPNGARELEVVVADKGVGIDADKLELIFEKFYQTGKVDFHSSGQTSFKGGGPGLGLAIARGIVQAHNGRIWAESEGYDETALPGSRFLIRLPLLGAHGS